MCASTPMDRFSDPGPFVPADTEDSFYIKEGASLSYIIAKAADKWPDKILTLVDELKIEPQSFSDRAYHPTQIKYLCVSLIK